MAFKEIKFIGSLIKYKVVGTGKPVVLLHGFGEDSSIWDEQIRSLQNDFQLIVPDLPGSGASEILKGDKLSMPDYAEVIKAVADAESLTKIIMIGHSMGGYITLAFAEKYPEMLSAFGLFHSGAYADDEAKKQTREKAILFIENNGTKAFLKTSIPGLFFDAEKSKASIHSLLEKGINFSSAALIQYYRAMIDRPDKTVVLKNFAGPVLFIIGEHDKAIPFQDSLRQSHLPFHAYIHILRNSAHMGMKEEIAKANKILAEFLQSA